MNLTDVIKKPLITEKATYMKELGNAVLFEVDRRAHKGQIQDAVEKMFKVKVESVRTMVVPGKTVRRGRSIGRRNAWKKAIVTLKEGQTIEFFEGV